jgi:uncharacterized protein (DUF305 family)
MRRLPTSLAALLLMFGLAACGYYSEKESAAPAESASSRRHNVADVQFATDMIQHHSQALEMVNLAIGRDLRPKVSQLVDDIMAAQTPEVTMMTTWLEEWDEEIPETSMDHSGHGTSDLDMPGMASKDDMSALESASDAKFEQMFLTMMIEHHNGAIEMAETALAEGQNAKAKELAQQVIDGQTVQVEVMNGLAK